MGPGAPRAYAAVVSGTVYEHTVGTARRLLRATAKRILPPNSCYTERLYYALDISLQRSVRFFMKRCQV